MVAATNLCLLFVWGAQTNLPDLPPPPPPPPGVEASPRTDAAALPTDAAPLPTDVTPSPSPPKVDAGAPAAAPVLREDAKNPQNKPTRRWYGWQTLTLDAIALASVPVVYAAGVRDKQSLLAVYVPAAVLFDLGAPTVHWLQRGPGIALASFGLRVGIPLVTLLTAPPFGHCVHGDDDAQQKCRSRAMGIGAAVGFAIAPMVDAAWLAWKPASREVGVTLRPSLLIAGKEPTASIGVGVAGSF